MSELCRWITLEGERVLTSEWWHRSVAPAGTAQSAEGVGADGAVGPSIRHRGGLAIDAGEVVEERGPYACGG